MSDSVARSRLTSERKNLRKDRPFGFIAKPETSACFFDHPIFYIVKLPLRCCFSNLVHILPHYPACLRRSSCCAISATEPDGSQNLMRWTCSIPGKEGTDWADASYPITLEFSDEYPSRPPIARCAPTPSAPRLNP